VGEVLTWNVAGRVRAVPDQARALAERSPDVVALQEVRAAALDAWEEALARLGYAHVAATLPVDATRRPPERRLGVLIASRAPIQTPAMVEVPWPERYLVARTELDGTIVELHNLHAPISSKAEQVKVRTLEAVSTALGAPSRLARILVGDLNTPQYESREGEVRSFARTRSGRIRPTHGERHDRAELGIVVGLRAHGYADAFRALHGYGRRDRSWLYPHGKTGYRLDHIIVRGLEVVACEYEHGWREAGLSDHAAMWADLRFAGSRGG
jgi:endonuclease/exonuclease/phosphatase family metal-dependent hydrolase